MNKRNLPAQGKLGPKEVIVLEYVFQSRQSGLLETRFYQYFQFIKCIACFEFGIINRPMKYRIYRAMQTMLLFRKEIIVRKELLGLSVLSIEIC